MTGLKPSKVLVMGLIIAAMVGGMYLFAWARDRLGEDEAVSVAGEVIGVKREVAIPVLLYHGIVAEADGSNVTVEDFRAQMAALHESGYTAVDTRDLLAYYTQGAELPTKPVVITFDDGRRDSYVNGGPILAEHGFKAVMFVITDKQEIEDAFFLSWDELAGMHASGMWDIESHGYNTHTAIRIDEGGNTGHAASNKMWIADESRLETDEEYARRLAGDLRKAKSDLESHLEGARVEAFAYPFSDFGQESVNMDAQAAQRIVGECVSAVYSLAFEVGDRGWDHNNYEDSDRLYLQRLMVGSDMSGEELAQVLDGAQPRGLPCRLSGFTDGDLYGLCCGWGTMRAEGEALALRADSGGTGTMALLHGCHYWKDYAAEAELSIDGGDNAYLVGRYKDDRNHVACKVNGGSVALVEKVGGEERILAQAEYLKPEGRYRVRLCFDGDTVCCQVDGAVALGPLAIDPSLSRGGVGFQAWDPRAGMAAATVWRVSVTRLRPLPQAGEAAEG